MNIIQLNRNHELRSHKNPKSAHSHAHVWAHQLYDDHKKQGLDENKKTPSIKSLNRAHGWEYEFNMNPNVIK